MTSSQPRTSDCRSIAVLELVGLLARAAGIGIAAGLLLGGAALLLSLDNVPVLSEAAEIHAASLARL
ncbi:MAG TPA: hypothetical protein VF816_16945 [Rhodocyclaceae bacterium]